MVTQLDILKKISHARSGQAYSSKISKTKVLLSRGDQIFQTLPLTWINTNRMSPAGMSIMGFGQVKLLQSSLLTLDGSISQLILFHSTMWCQDFKGNFQDILLLGLTTLKAHLTIGFMKDQILTAHGLSPKECGDGWNGMMVPTFSSLTNQKQDGITFQTVASTLNATQDTVSITQNMSIITTCILMCTSNREKPEVLKDHHQTLSYKKENSVMKADGEK